MIRRLPESGRPRGGWRSDSGVTLLELLAAVAITAMVLVSVSLMAIQLSVFYARFSRENQDLAQWYAVDRVLSGVAQSADRVDSCGSGAVCLSLFGGGLPADVPATLGNAGRIGLKWAPAGGGWRLVLFSDPPHGVPPGSGGYRGSATAWFVVGEFSSSGSLPSVVRMNRHDGFSVSFPGGQTALPGQVFLTGKVP